MTNDDAVREDVAIDDRQAIEMLDLLSSVSVEQLQIIRNYLIVEMFFNQLAQNKEVLKN